jgi:tetratricopeptide (TPR) repeat protein
MKNTRSTSRERAEFDALVTLAQREHGAGRLAEATAAYQKILALRPDIAEAHNDLGILLAQQGKFEQAVASFEKAVALKPDLLAAHNNLGLVLRDLGRLDQAAARFRQAIALSPDVADTHNNLGDVLLSQGKLDEAAARFQQAIALRPDFADAHNNLGNVLWKQRKAAEATARFRHALALRPNYPEAHNNLGIILAQQNQLEEAAARFEQAIALRPDYAEALNNLGSVLWKQNKLDQATACFERALALRPDYAEAHNNLGDTLNIQGRFAEAVPRFERAISLRPGYAEAYNNLGNVLLNQGKFDEAAPRYQQALALKPDFVDAHLGLATCNLAKGDYARGWPGYEWRLRVHSPELPAGVPRWNGEPLEGRSVLLVAEQGLGDTIHFVRYGRLLAQLGARVVLACPAALGRLLSSYPDVDELFIQGSGKDLPRCDFYLPLLSAPLALGTTAATIPRDVPYLSADAELTQQWRRELAAIAGFKIGIAWQGERGYLWDRWRSIPLAHFAPLARLPGVRLVSLQKGFGTEQMATVDFPVLDLSGRLDEAAGPFMDTAAVMRSVDLVVTSDTAIAHLAGALGVPVWVALHFSAEWRWLRERDDSPWYPTMRLFRQSRFGEWPDVFERIAAAVREKGV